MTGITLKGYKCDRVAVGPFERGPIHVLYEFHANADYPETCLEGRAGTGDIGILTTIVLDDEELVGFLAENLRLPAMLGSISESSTDAGPGAIHTWSWQVEGHDESTITVPESGDASGSGGIPERLFWENNGRVHQADFVHRDVGPQIPAAATGKIQPPFYLGSDSQGAFAAFGTMYPAREAAASFRSYGDLECKIKT